MPMSSPSIDIFVACDDAITNGALIRRPHDRDKEFAFQAWFEDRLRETGLAFSRSPRNSYPDFLLNDVVEGYEIKGLTVPGRDASYDSNSAVPSGRHNGYTIFYVFGRYPQTTEAEYPVVDLVICHGDFLNAQHDYTHQNRSLTGFGSYGDILIRDRKMYVPPTVYALAHGLSGQRTLIVPADSISDTRIEPVGQLERVESDDLIAGYSFDLASNTLTVERTANPRAGTRHRFVAYRRTGTDGPVVTLTTITRR